MSAFTDRQKDYFRKLYFYKLGKQTNVSDEIKSASDQYTLNDLRTILYGKDTEKKSSIFSKALKLLIPTLAISTVANIAKSLFTFSSHTDELPTQLEDYPELYTMIESITNPNDNIIKRVSDLDKIADDIIDGICTKCTKPMSDDHYGICDCGYDNDRNQMLMYPDTVREIKKIISDAKLPVAPLSNYAIVKESLQESMLLEGREGTVTKGCVMLMVEDYGYYSLFDSLGLQIDKNDLHEYGIEDKPHVTLLYGLDNGVSPELVRGIISTSTIGESSIDKLSLFENDEYDVLKFNVECSSLSDINKRLRDLPYKNSYNEYIPHMTVAYLKKGMGKKYVDNYESKKLRIGFTQCRYTNVNPVIDEYIDINTVNESIRRRSGHKSRPDKEKSDAAKQRYKDNKDTYDDAIAKRSRSAKWKSKMKQVGRHNSRQSIVDKIKKNVMGESKYSTLLPEWKPGKHLGFYIDIDLSDNDINTLSLKLNLKRDEDGNYANNKYVVNNKRIYAKDKSSALDIQRYIKYDESIHPVDSIIDKVISGDNLNNLI